MVAASLPLAGESGAKYSRRANFWRAISGGPRSNGSPSLHVGLEGKSQRIAGLDGDDARHAARQRDGRNCPVP